MSEDKVTFRDFVRRAEQQTEIDTFHYRDRAVAGEICRIIAEVYLLAKRADGGIRVSGELIPYEIAAEVYETLRPEHLEYVIEDYRSKTYGIRNPKAYLRVALYNAAFRMELGYQNEILSSQQFDGEKT